MALADTLKKYNVVGSNQTAVMGGKRKTTIGHRASVVTHIQSGIKALNKGTKGSCATWGNGTWSIKVLMQSEYLLIDGKTKVQTIKDASGDPKKVIAFLTEIIDAVKNGELDKQLTAHMDAIRDRRNRYKASASKK